MCVRTSIGVEGSKVEGKGFVCMPVEGNLCMCAYL